MSHRRGERHPRARLSDYEVDLMRELYETYDLSVAEIARKFEVPYWTARDIVQYRTRVERAA